MASTANNTMYPEESISNANNESPPLATAIEIYVHTNKALQALSEGNTSEVENQLNSTKEKLLLIMSAQEGQESNITQMVTNPGANSNTDISGDTAINSAEDMAVVEFATRQTDETTTIEPDVKTNNQGISEKETREKSEELPQGVP